MLMVHEMKTDRIYKIKKKVLVALIGVLVISILVSAVLLNNALINESDEKTRELSLSIRSSIESLMLHGDPNL
jgi:sensor domain CHASE-containing protein